MMTNPAIGLNFNRIAREHSAWIHLSVEQKRQLDDAKHDIIAWFMVGDQDEFALAIRHAHALLVAFDLDDDHYRTKEMK